MLYAYCERTGPGLFAEPLNTLTNAAFFVAAWAGWRLARRRGTLHAGTLGLLVLLAAIGVGSALYHMFANAWSRALDVLPILGYQLLAIWLYVRSRGSIAAAALAWAVFCALTVLAARASCLPDTLRIYGAAWLSLLALGVHRRLRQPRDAEAWTLLTAAGVFALSLGFRALDQTSAVAAHLPHGTHFLWHILNGVTLYLVFRVIAL